jgi:hypothetical protein
MKSVTVGQGFTSAEWFKQKAMTVLTEILKNGFQQLFRELYERWQIVSLPKRTMQLSGIVV